MQFELFPNINILIAIRRIKMIGYIKMAWDEIKYFIQIVNSGKVYCEIQPVSIEWEGVKLIKFKLKNFGPDNAYNIKLRTFGLTFQETKEGKDGFKAQVKLLNADGPSIINLGETKDFEADFLHFNVDFPFLMECTNVNFNKSKIIWKYTKSTGRCFMLLKKKEIRKIKRDLIFISIFKRKDYLKYKPH
jgi:hypothetical protein